MGIILTGYFQTRKLPLEHLTATEINGKEGKEGGREKREGKEGREGEEGRGGEGMVLCGSVGQEYQSFKSTVAEFSFF